MNRQLYDECAYNQAVGLSTAPINYLLDTVMYEHCDKCRMELGVVGGMAVSRVHGNLVDLESNLMGMDRPCTRCTQYLYHPRGDEVVQGVEYIKPVQHPPVDVRLVNLPSCQMQDFPPVPLPPAQMKYSCPPPSGGQMQTW